MVSKAQSPFLSRGETQQVASLYIFLSVISQNIFLDWGAHTQITNTMSQHLILPCEHLCLSLVKGALVTTPKDPVSALLAY